MIFRKGGPFPPARLTHRFAAFFLDSVLMGAISFFILTRFILPTHFPLELEIFEQWYFEFSEQQRENPNPFATPPLDELPPEVWSMLLVAQNTFVLLFWIYFAASDTFFQGQTLGKRTFRLKIIHMVSLGSPDLASAFIRASFKTICIFTLFPFALINFLVVFFLKYRRAGHDFFSKTLVVEDNAPSAPKGAADSPGDSR